MSPRGTSRVLRLRLGDARSFAFAPGGNVTLSDSEGSAQAPWALIPLSPGPTVAKDTDDVPVVSGMRATRATGRPEAREC